MVVNSLSDWVQLPEVGCPVIEQTEQKGSIYTVHKVGILALPPGSFPSEGAAGVVMQAGKYLLPTIEVEFGGTRQLCKLPIALSDWAIDLVALTRQIGRNPFPASVEFGILDGHHYAELL